MNLSIDSQKRLEELQKAHGMGLFKEFMAKSKRTDNPSKTINNRFSTNNSLSSKNAESNKDIHSYKKNYEHSDFQEGIPNSYKMY